ARGELHGRWPLARWDERRTATIRVLSEADLLWRLDGPERVLAGTWISTGRATVETVILRPGQRTELAPAPAATCAYVLDGRLGVRLPDGDRPWLELEPGDGLHLTAATVHRFGSFGSTPTRILRLVAT
ncbi:MAG TPA: cupin domain-containing protein, partial [Gaiellaceae bacterium]